MILFYDKNNGEIFASIDGRVHNEDQLNCYVNNGIGEENIGKYVIGWIAKNGSKIEQNIDKFDILQRFEDITPDSPLDYKIDIETNNLVKK
jgi:hypothetical protein